MTTPQTPARKRGRPAIPTPPKSCAWCGKALVRTRWASGRVETRAQFEARRYCSVRCHGEASRRDEDTPRHAPPHRPDEAPERPRTMHGYERCLVCDTFRPPHRLVPSKVEGWSHCEDAAACMALKNAEPGPDAGVEP